MKKKVWILFVLIYAFQVKAQIYFDKKIDMNYSEAAMNILPIENNEYISVFQKVVASSQALYIVKLDSNGDTLWAKSVYKNNFTFYAGRNSLLRMKDSCFLIAGTITDSLGMYSAYLMKFNINGDSLWMKLFPYTYFISGKDCYENNDKTLLLTGEIDLLNNGYSDLLLIKTDSFGNMKWQKTYNGIGSESSECCKQTLDGGYIMAGSSQPNGIESDNFIVKTDSAGTFKWSQFYNFGYADALCWLSQLPDSNYIQVGTHDMGNGNYQGVIRKLNKVGNMVWQKQFTNNSICQFGYEPLLYQNGDVSVLGFTTNTLNKYEGFLFKINSSGNELWRRSYTTNPNIDHIFYDFHKTPDNGFIICGAAPGNGQDAWIIKVDSFGCEVAGCDGVGINEFNNVQDGLMFNVFPNPSDGKISFEMNEEIENPLIEITDLTGKLIFTENKFLPEKTFQINLEHLEGGFYFLKVKDKNGNLKGVQKFLIQN